MNGVVTGWGFDATRAWNGWIFRLLMLDRLSQMMAGVSRGGCGWAESDAKYRGEAAVYMRER